MFNKSSPLYIKPRLDTDFIKWTLAFNKSCTAKHVRKSIPIIKDITLLSQELYSNLKKDEGFLFHFENKGLLMLCQSEKMLEEEIKVANLAREIGLEASEISMEDLKKPYWPLDWGTSKVFKHCICQPQRIALLLVVYKGGSGIF